MKTRYTKEETTPQEIQSQIGIAKDGKKGLEQRKLQSFFLKRNYFILFNLRNLSSDHKKINIVRKH